MSDHIPAIERAFTGISSVFQHPSHAASLQGHLEHVYYEATKAAWKAAMKIAPSEEMLAAAKQTVPYGVYTKDAVLVPEVPTREWACDRVRSQAEALNTDRVRALCGGEPWCFLNLSLVTRDGEEHHLHIRTLDPWPPSQEAAEAEILRQIEVLLGAQVQTPARNDTEED